MENQFLCRSVQWLLKGGLYFIRWKTPELLQGANALELLVKDINAYDCRKVLLVTTASRRNMKLLQGIRMALERQQIQYEIFSDVQSNPTDRQVECGVTLFQIAGCDSILCFGGGSVIDCGKAIGARIARPRKTIRQLQGIFRVRHALPPLFAVPTTAGSGSEGTNAAVIT